MEYIVKMAEATRETKTKAQRAAELRLKLKELEDQAETEALDEIKVHLQTLEELGKPHVVISQAELDSLKTATAPKSTAKGPGRPKGATAAPKPAPGPSANYVDNKSCPVCNGLVGHDGRAHRSQVPKVKFTNEELTERGLQPPA